jgi:N-formylmaleamate deformylase
MLPNWTQQDLRVNGVRLHFSRTGSGDKRPLVLVHGFSDNGLCWTPVARDLESEYDVILPDMRGHGLSERVHPGEAVDMAADLSGLIRMLGLKGSILVGHSMGAMVAYQTVLRFPELADGLALEDPPWWMSPPVPAAPSAGEAENPMSTWAKSLSGRTLDELLAQYRKEHPGWPDELMLPMCESKKQLDPAIVEPMVEKMHAPESDWRTTVAGVTRPMLIITGSPALGGIVTPEVAAKVRELNPRVVFAGVPDVGHLVRFDDFPAYMKILRRFLRQVAQGSGRP